MCVCVSVATAIVATAATAAAAHILGMLIFLYVSLRLLTISLHFSDLSEWSVSRF